MWIFKNSIPQFRNSNILAEIFTLLHHFRGNYHNTTTFLMETITLLQLVSVNCHTAKFINGSCLTAKIFTLPDTSGDHLPICRKFLVA